MLHRLITGCIDRQVSSGRMKEEDRELYEYAYQLLLLQAGNVLILIAIGVGFSCLFPLLLFAAAYIPLRSFAGGWHASTPARCSFVSAALELGAAVLLRFSDKLLYLPAYLPLLLILMIPAGLIIWRKAPSDAASKPLIDGERVRYRKMTMRIWAAELFLYAVSLLFRWQDMALILLFAHWTEAVMLLCNHRI